MPEPDDIADTNLLVASVRRAGEIARRFYGGTFRSWQKSRGNPVTEADIEIDHFLKDTLLDARPDYGWLSEESADNPERLTRNRVFVVDPIDGTHGFIRQRPTFTIVAAVVRDGRPVAAAIHNPITGEMFEGAKRNGARKNGIPVRVSARSELEGARILVEKKLIDRARWADPFPRTVKSETRSSAAYRLALIASGEFDATFSLTRKSDWDLAAGDLIVSEAGGVVTGRHAQMLVYNRPSTVHGSVIAAGPQLHARIIARIPGYRAGP